MSILTRPKLTACTLAIAAALTLSACGGPSKDASGSASKEPFNTGPHQNRYAAPKVDSIAAEVPAAIRSRGTLEIGNSKGSTAPLTFFATDNKTLIGVETDMAYAIASVFGLKAHYNPVSFEQVFVGLDSGKYDVGVTNITVTELRKQKYDMATYRKDAQAFEAKKGATWRVTGPKDVAGRTIAVPTGTSEEKALLDWSAQNVKAGRKAVNVKYYQDESACYLALQSGQIDAYLHPNPEAQYHARTSGQTQVVGDIIGAGKGLEGLIAATTKKDNGLGKPLNDAINYLIKKGVYGKILARWDLTSDAVSTSRLNPPGLPIEKK
ncbi:ABC transporter substrate-binding protein [Streptomyces rugosispiralis]|uniref:ABC transporter substrate-binding protein n=1 Tax=Streptomyces rugosispiralis TaxID=2967341 RepID=A0ABT1UQJ3_9ACTN|nr:ABC transporter substrate-binding protein [Streptomyces rugosispiralis]MCQ8186855.1 ABC transporter substrate-binding protein [Streptomyces rugosispiralis]